ncbi:MULTISPECIES: hypothetical protein [unclassified Halomonas]|uniref:hypothetical protein n=1 Tax=unclassified Halomonas TaxID=2609666 RepID=UPI0028853D5A|nr:MULTISPECIES: hypothetical protein [unclassified Halomonas]MDT0499965.1 hypothetical protein [Halomonas sp. PAR7]MDT0512369.1 hypothetical protein [Halomonas sp. LES1]MDT0591003.1 hypothetical protein [Halomonas sp. PAR8]
MRRYLLAGTVHVIHGDSAGPQWRAIAGIGRGRLADIRASGLLCARQGAVG